jgi:lipoprotein-releasing system ATP-binding protein
MGSFIDIQNVRRSYGPVKAVDGVTLKLDQGQQYAIQGASGSGKSTLLYLIGGLDRPSEGDVLIEGASLSKLSDEGLAEYRNRWVGFMFQFHFLLPSLDAMGNILLPARIGGQKISDVEGHAKSLARVLGVQHCLSKYPFELSGGEQQRINLIRALSLKPRLLLCDEPTGNLDSENSLKVIDLLQSLSQEYGSTLVVVTHDPSVVAKFQTVFTMRDGKILQ